MPKAYVNKDETTHHDLKSCPGGFVKLRKLTYGESIHRRQITSAMRMTAGEDQSFVGEMDLTNFDAVQYELSKCVVEHNLEKDDKGNQFDFSRAADLQLLDPRIGEEIQEQIRKMNEFNPDLEDDEVKGKSEPASLETSAQKSNGS